VFFYHFDFDFLALDCRQYLRLYKHRKCNKIIIDSWRGVAVEEDYEFIIYDFTVIIIKATCILMTDNI